MTASENPSAIRSESKVRWGWTWVFPILLFTWGSIRAFQTDAHDFKVFYQAGQSVLAGRALLLYRDPHIHDVFLYAPGFAWLMIPFSLLPASFALTLWLGLKIGLFALLIRKTQALLPAASAWIAPTATLWIARPLLIDLEYGQVNSLILCAGALAILAYFDPRSTRFKLTGHFAAFTVLAIAKLFPLPVLGIPFVSWIRKRSELARFKAATLGTLLGLLLVALIPLTRVSLSDFLPLLYSWREGLVAKGLPLGTHNQSWIAFLFRFFTDTPSLALSEGGRGLLLGHAWLTTSQVRLLGGLGSLVAFGFLLEQIRRFRAQALLDL